MRCSAPALVVAALVAALLLAPPALADSTSTSTSTSTSATSTSTSTSSSSSSTTTTTTLAQCNNLPLPINGLGSGGPGCSDATPVDQGTTCTIMCEFGFQMPNVEGDEVTASCGAGGLLTLSAPAENITCEPVDCGPLPLPTNGKLVDPSCGTTAGSVCEIDCLEGHRVLGEGERECEKTGRWNGFSTVSCQDIDACEGLEPNPCLPDRAYCADLLAADHVNDPGNPGYFCKCRDGYGGEPGIDGRGCYPTELKFESEEGSKGLRISMGHNLDVKVKYAPGSAEPAEVALGDLYDEITTLAEPGGAVAEAVAKVKALEDGAVADTAELLDEMATELDKADSSIETLLEDIGAAEASIETRQAAFNGAVQGSDSLATKVGNRAAAIEERLGELFDALGDLGDEQGELTQHLEETISAEVQDQEDAVGENIGEVNEALESAESRLGDAVENAESKIEDYVDKVDGIVEKGTLMQRCLRVPGFKYNFDTDACEPIIACAGFSAEKFYSFGVRQKATYVLVPGWQAGRTNNFVKHVTTTLENQAAGGKFKMEKAGIYGCSANLQFQGVQSGAVYYAMIAVVGQQAADRKARNMVSSPRGSGNQHMQVGGIFDIDAGDELAVYVYSNNDDNFNVETSSGFHCAYLGPRKHVESFAAMSTDTFSAGTSRKVVTGWTVDKSPNKLWSQTDGLDAANGIFTPSNGGLYLMYANLRFSGLDQVGSHSSYYRVGLNIVTGNDAGILSNIDRIPSISQTFFLGGVFLAMPNKGYRLYADSRSDGDWKLHGEASWSMARLPETLPFRPSFFAEKDSNQASYQSQTAIKGWGTSALYPRFRHAVKNALDVDANGQATAPVSGVYQVHGQLRHDCSGGASYGVRTYIEIDGVFDIHNGYHGVMFGHSCNYFTGYIQAYMWLNKGQKVAVKGSMTRATTLHARSSFSMTLISTDDFESWEAYLEENNLLNRHATASFDPGFYSGMN